MNAAQLSRPKETAEIAIRVGTDADYPLVSNAFMYVYTGAAYFDRYGKGYRAASYYGYRVPPDILAVKFRQLYDNPNWQLSIACPTDNHDEIMGALLSHNSKRAIAWITVKPHYQRSGVAKALLVAAQIEPGEVDCAFLLSDVAKWATKLGYTLRFRPYLPDMAQLELLQAQVGK